MADQEKQDTTTKEEEWPNLYQETVEMAVDCMGVFAFADLRALARKGELLDQDADRVLHGLPINFVELKELWKRNEGAIKKIRSRDIYDETGPSGLMEPRREDLQVHYVGDEKCKEECVYAIGTDSKQKRITLTFRGSITAKDWVKDAKTLIGSIPNPAANLEPKQPDTVGVHLGYRDYLYGEQSRSLHKLVAPSSKKDESSDLGEKPKKIQIILDQIRTLLSERPDYKVYVTGHSLGGALAVLAALEAAAAFGGRPHPVTCITLGNPKAGNYRFRAAMGLLEAKKKLRCMGIHNFLDAVPTIPPEHNFCHVGMIMELFKNHFEISYVGGSVEKQIAWTKTVLCWTNCLRGCLYQASSCRPTDRVILHDYREYFERLVAQKEELSKLTLNGLYEKEKL